MEEIKDKVIVLKSTNSKEKDKIVSLFCLTKGKLNATLKGVLNPKAKLKFLAQPFCFAEVSLVKRGSFYTVTNAYAIETFFSLTSDLEKYYIACGVLEILNTFTLNESDYPEIFVSALKAFEFMEFEGTNPKTALIKFMLDAFKASGYGLRLDFCSECGAKILTEPYFDLSSGNVLCLSCKTQYSVKLTNQILANLKIINKEDFSNLKTIRISSAVQDEILNLLKKAYYSKFGVELKSF